MAKKTAATPAEEVPAAPVAAPRQITLKRGLRFGTKRYGKNEKIDPAVVGLSAEQVKWLIDMDCANEVESEGGEA